MKRRVVIFGGGVAGLTVAHMLAFHSREQLEIHVFEREDQFGGLARSARTPSDQGGCAIEYCWRVYFGFYTNLRRLLSEIPFVKINGDSKKDSQQESSENHVIDYLVPYHNVLAFPTKKPWITNPAQQLGAWVELISILVHFCTSCDDRAKEMDQVSWNDLFSKPQQEEAPWSAVSQWLGLDRYCASFYSVARVGFEDQILSLKPNHVFQGPTSECWFAHWVNYLTTRGQVHLHTQTQLEALELQQESKIIKRAWISLNVSNKENKQVWIPIDADQFVLALGVQQVADLLRRQPKLQISAGLGTVPRLAEIGYQIQVSFQLNLNRPVRIGPTKENSILLVDSPWAIIIEIREESWNGTTRAFCIQDPRVRGQWSILAGQARVPGLLIKKPFPECTEEEIHQELWYQMMLNQDLKDRVAKYNSFPLSSSLILYWSRVWPTFYWGAQGELKTREPKFSNNAGTLRLRPPCKTQVENLILAGAYTQEALDIFSMEGACRSGMAAAHLISSTCPVPIIDERPWFFKPWRQLDERLYKKGWPNIGPWLVPLWIPMFFFQRLRQWLLHAKME